MEPDRRKLLALLPASGFVVARQWQRLIVESVVFPAHAQTTSDAHRDGANDSHCSSNTKIQVLPDTLSDVLKITGTCAHLSHPDFPVSFIAAIAGGGSVTGIIGRLTAKAVIK